jgi:hypothetical protein
MNQTPAAQAMILRACVHAMGDNGSMAILTTRGNDALTEHPGRSRLLGAAGKRDETTDKVTPRI